MREDPGRIYGLDDVCFLYWIDREFDREEKRYLRRSLVRAYCGEHANTAPHAFAGLVNTREGE